MRRLHLFEFGDLAWFPQLPRDAETAYCRSASRGGRRASRISVLLPVGRQRVVFDRQKVTELRKSGASIREIAKKLGLGNLGRIPRLSLARLWAQLTDFYPSAKPLPHPRMTWGLGVGRGLPYLIGKKTG